MQNPDFSCDVSRKDAMSRIAKIVFLTGFLAIALSAGAVTPSKFAFAKSKMTVKMSPEFTRHKKGGGTTDTATTSSAQTAGNRSYRQTKGAQSPKPKLTPDKVEAGQENTR